MASVAVDQGEALQILARILLTIHFTALCERLDKYRSAI